VLPLVVGLLALSVLFARERIVGRTGDDRLTTYSTQPQGAQLFYELAQRLGWVVRRREGSTLPGGTGIIHAVLDPPIDLRIAEVHELLEDVRGGNALLVVLAPRTGVIADSLHFRVDQRDFYARPVLAELTGTCPDTLPLDPFEAMVELWPDGRAHLYALAATAPPPEGLQEFVTLGAASDAERAARAAEVDADSVGPSSEAPLDPRPSVVGFPLGRGRVVVASDPDFLRNDVLRVCRYGLDVRAVRALEYLRDGAAAPRRIILFDEYHQGYGEQPGSTRTIASYLSGVSSGRLVLQLAVAGLVLILALAPRAIRPRDPERIERRSPLEHVDALARAYAQVGAARTATTHLLRGVRRRLERGAGRLRAIRTDEEFLRRVEQTDPALAGDAELVRRALADGARPEALAEAGAALGRIEASLIKG
jgi:hypothetical protein